MSEYENPVESETEDDVEIPGVLVLEENSGYMESTLFFFALLHSFLSFSVLVSYYLLKVRKEIIYVDWCLVSRDGLSSDCQS